MLAPASLEVAKSAFLISFEGIDLCIHHVEHR